MDGKEKILSDLKENIVKGMAPASVELTKKSLEMDTDPDELLAVMTEAMTIVGEYFETKKYYLPNVLTSANAFELAFQLVQPKLLERAAAGGPSSIVIIGVCEGDIHDIGKKIVTALLRAAGYEVYDMGRDVPNLDFIENVVEKKAQILAMSSLMTTSMREMKDTMSLLKEEGVRDKVKVMVGGGPITMEFCEQIGADGYGKDGLAAVKVAMELTGK